MDPSPRAGLQKAPPQSAQRRAVESSWRWAHWARPFDLALVFCLAPGLLQAVKLYLQRQRLLRDLRHFPWPPTHWFYRHHKVDRGKGGVIISFIPQIFLMPPMYKVFKVKQLPRSEEHTSELQSLTTISYAVFCLKKKN